MSDAKNAKHDEHGKKKHKKHHAHGGGGHGDGEHEGAPEWLISFADNVMLQMGFFVILLALMIGEKAKGPTTEGEGQSADSAFLLDAAIAIREGFNRPVDLSSSDPNDAALIRRIKERMRQNDPNEVGSLGTDRDAQTVRPSDYTGTGASVLFTSGVSTLGPGELEKLAHLSKRLAGSRWIIEIRGHASSLETFRDPERGRQLGYSRAVAVARVLVDGGLDWRQLRLVSVGDADPVVPRAGRGEHANNQRVEVVVRTETMPPDPFARDGPGGGG